MSWVEGLWLRALGDERSFGTDGVEKKKKNNSLTKEYPHTLVSGQEPGLLGYSCAFLHLLSKVTSLAAFKVLTVLVIGSKPPVWML